MWKTYLRRNAQQESNFDYQIGRAFLLSSVRISLPETLDAMRQLTLISKYLYSIENKSTKTEIESQSTHSQNRKSFPSLFLES